MARWRLNDAQKHFSEVVERAFSEGPQRITLPRGRTVLVSPEKRKAARKKVKEENLAVFFGKVPLAEILPPRSREKIGPGLKFE